jgi:hypothetical protein
MLTLRLLSAVTPLAIAGLVFGRGPARAYGVIQKPLDEFGEGQLREIFADPRIDVSISAAFVDGEPAFLPVADLMDLARLRQRLTEWSDADIDALLGGLPLAEPVPERRDTLTILAEAAQQDAARAEPKNPPGAEPEGAEPAAGATPAATTDTTAAAPTGAAPAAEGADTGQAAPAPAAGEASGTPAANPDPPAPRPPRRARPATT